MSEPQIMNTKKQTKVNKYIMGDKSNYFVPNMWKLVIKDYLDGFVPDTNCEGSQVHLPRVPVGKRSKTVQDEFWKQQGTSGALNAYRQLTSSIHKGGRKQTALPGGKLQPLFKNYTAPPRLNGSKFGNTKNVLPGIPGPGSQSDNAALVQHVVTGNLENLPYPAKSTIRIYLASNYDDMKAERSILMKQAVPKIQEFCSKQGLLFQLVDLNWGMEPEEHEVLGCSRDRRQQEIADCQRLSLGPNFVALLGDSYGKQHVVQEIPEAEFDVLQSVAMDKSLHNAELLAKCYIRDHNAVPAVYILQVPQAEGNVVSLREVLTKAASLAVEEGRLQAHRLQEYMMSGLAQDITQGIFENQNPRNHCLAYRREWRHIAQQVTSPGADTYVDTVSSDGHVQVDTERNQLNHNLSDQVLEHLGVGGCKQYFLSWDNKGKDANLSGNEYNDYLERLCSDFVVDVKHLILQGLHGSSGSPNKKTETAVYEEVLHHAHHASLKTVCAQGQNEIMEQLQTFLRNPKENSKLFVVHGPAGSGKTVTMAMIAKQLKKWFTKECTVVTRFLGTTSNSCSIHSTVVSITLQICMAYNIKLPHVNHECSTLFKALSTMRSVIDKVSKEQAFMRPLFIVLDGLDHLQPHEESLRALWAMKELPCNVHIVVSTLPKLGSIDLLGALLTLVTDEQSSREVQPFSLSNLMHVLNKTNESMNRKLTEHQQNAVLSCYSKSNLPLHLSILMKESLRWKSYHEENDLSVPQDLTESLTKALETLEGQLGSNIVSFFAAYITAVPVGIHERELVDLLTFNKDVMREVNTIHDHSSDGMLMFPSQLFSILKYGLRDFLTENCVYGNKVLAWSHRVFLEHIAEKYQVIFPGIQEESISDDSTSFTLMLHEHMANMYLCGKKLDTLDDCSSDMSDSPLEDDLCTLEMPQPLTPLNQLKLNRLPAHLKVLLPLEGIKRINELMLFNFEWIRTKLEAVSAQEMIADMLGIFALLRQLEEQGIVQEDGKDPLVDLDILFEFLQLAEPALAQDPSFFPFEIWGRLMAIAEENESIKLLVTAATEWAKGCEQKMLYPLYPTLTAPGQPLRHVLDGPTHFAGSLQDGQVIVMFSQQTGTEIWKLETGELLQRFPVNKEQDVANVIPGNSAEFVIIGHFSYLNSVMDLSVWSSETGVRLVHSMFPHKFDTIALNSTDNLLMVATVVENTDPNTGTTLTRVLLGVDVHTKEVKHTLPTQQVHSEGITKILFLQGSGGSEMLVTLGTENTKDVAVWNLDKEDIEYRVELSHFPDLLQIDTERNCLVCANRREGEVSLVNLTQGEITFRFANDSIKNLVDMIICEDIILVATQSDGIHRYSIEKGVPEETIGKPSETDMKKGSPTALCVINKNFLFVGYESGLIQLYHMDTGECLTDLQGHTKRINTLNCLLNKWLVSAGNDEQAMVWSLENMKKVMEQKKTSTEADSGPCPSGDEDISCCLVSDNGEEVYTASWTGPIKVWSTDTGKLKRVFENSHSEGVSHLYWAYKTQLLVGHGIVPDMADVRSLKVWQAAKGQDVPLSEGEVLVYCSCVFTEAQDRLLTISPTTDPLLNTGILVGIYDLYEMKCISVLHCNIYGSMNTSNLSLLGFTSYTQAESAVISTISEAQASNQSKQIEAIATKMQRLYGVLDYFPNPEMSFFFTFVVEGGNLEKICMDHHEPIHLDTHSPKCSVVVQEGCCISGCIDGSLIAWDVATQNIIAHVYDHSLAKAVREGRVTSKHRLSHKPAHEGPITCLAISIDAKVLVSGGIDDKVKVWLLGDRQLLHELTIHTNHITSLNISSDGSMIASGSQDKSLVLWKSDNGTKLTTFYTHYPVSEVQMVPSKKRVVLKLAGRKPKISLLEMMNF